MPKRNGCRGKVRHASKQGACIAARKIKNCALNVYQCGQCGSWHLGRTRDPCRRANRITQVLEAYDRNLAERMTRRG